MSDVYTSIMVSTIPITIILLLISAGIYALVYMASKFLNNDKLRKWVEGEIHQSFATAVFLFLSVAFITVFINLSGVFMDELIKVQGLDKLYDYMTGTGRVEITNNNQKFEEMYNLEKPLFSDEEEKDRIFNSDSHMKYGRIFLLHQLDRLNSAYDIVFWTNYIFGTPFSIFFPESGKYLTNFVSSPINSLKESIFSYLFYGFFFTYLQLALLDLIQVFFFFMFPAGIFLRAFTLTNSVGSAMIAISVGIFFVYPTVLGILLITNYNELGIEETDIIKMAMAEEPSEFLNYQLQVFDNYESVKPASVVDRVSNTAVQSFELIFNFARTILLHMFLFPMIAFTATYTFIHAFAGFMQANVSELGRGLIRLV